jgi:hypothetical protein
MIKNVFNGHFVTMKIVSLIAGLGADLSFGFWVLGFGFWVLGFGFWVE